jgi:hypothetical protein
MDEYQMEFSTGFGESFKDCPACGKEMVAGHSECFSCGTVIDRFQTRKLLQQSHESIGGIDHLTSIDLKKLDKKWKQVVVNYHDQKGHHDFIQMCQDNGALPFAVFHYSKMLEIDKEDDIAQIMRRQTLSRLTVMTEPSGEPQLDRKPVLQAVEVMIKWANWIGILLSTSCVTAGLMIPNSRNLVGLGVAALTLFVSLLIYRRS